MSRNLRRACLLAAGGLLLPARAAHSQDKVAAKAAEALATVRKGEGEARIAAARDLAALGAEGFRHLLADPPPGSDAGAWEALAEGLGAKDPAQAASDLLSYRSGWPRQAKERVEGLLAALRDGIRGPRRQRSELAEAVVEGATDLPPFLWIPLVGEGTLPDGFAPGPVAFAVDDRGLRVDAAGKGRADKRLGAALQILRLGPRGGERPVAFVRRMDLWYAASASVLRGKMGREPLEFLDGNGDGALDGPEDWVRVGRDAAFQRVHPDRTLWTEKGMAIWAIVTGEKGPEVDWFPEPAPSWAEAKHLAAWEWLNRWRAEAGIPPVRLDRPWTEAGDLHARYMAFHGISHEEEEGKEGYTREGRSAGMTGSIGGYAEPLELIESISATILHRVSLVGRAEDGMGLGSGPGGSVARGGPIDVPAGTPPVLVPGAGQGNVPRTCNRERPTPDRVPMMYEAERGYPVSVHFPGYSREWTDIRFELFEGPREKEVFGYTFSPKEPVTTTIGLEKNYWAAHFVSRDPLRPATEYTARFTAARPGTEPLVLVWGFRTR